MRREEWCRLTDVLRTTLFMCCGAGCCAGLGGWRRGGRWVEVDRVEVDRMEGKGRVSRDVVLTYSKPCSEEVRFQ